MNIIVNGRKHTVTDVYITYERIVGLGGLVLSSYQINFIRWKYGQGLGHGVLKPKDSILTEEGMVFSYTGSMPVKQRTISKFVESDWFKTDPQSLEALGVKVEEVLADFPTTRLIHMSEIVWKRDHDCHPSNYTSRCSAILILEEVS